MALTNLTRDAVLMAMKEFNELGRHTFLKKYGFGKSVDYIILENGIEYDSKAIAGVAHGYLPEQELLKADSFSGGEPVTKPLASLGFTITSPSTVSLPAPGEVLTNTDITTRFRVGNMGGMRRNITSNILVLISDPFKGLYQDRWEKDVFHYTGMGKIGDQTLTYSQNKTLSEAPKTKTSLHLLEALEYQKYTYVGEVELTNIPHQEQQLDENGNDRKVWMFPLKLKSNGVVPVLTKEQALAIEKSHSIIASKLTTKELKLRAQRSKPNPTVRTAQTSVFVRDAAVAEYVKRLANGICDLCQQPSPFKTRKNEAYLECHHIVWLAHSGEDTIENTVALCPNCHRKMHVLNNKVDRDSLSKRISERA